MSDKKQELYTIFNFPSTW